MLVVLIFCVSVISVCYGDITSNYFCADMNPQPHVNIEQLMGMWFGIEILSHDPEQKHWVRVEPACPIIHLSEDHTVTTTYNPLYGSYNYDQNYGQGHGDYNYRTTQGRLDYNNRQYNNDNRYNQNQGGFTNTYDRERERQRERERERLRTSTYGYDVNDKHIYNPKFDQNDYRTDYNRNNQNRNYDPNRNYNLNYNNRQFDSYGNPRYGGADWTRRREEIKRLRLFWDEGGSTTEYHLRYNVSRAGFWISSGPENGSSLDPQYSHFAGTVQVIKAVGNHMVLTFCHGLPDRQLYSVLLSRENRLDQVDIHGVHNLLNRKGLSTSNIKKVCNSATILYFNISNLLSMLLFIFISKLGHYL